MVNAFYFQLIIKVILIESIRLYCLNTRRYGTCTWKVDTQFAPHSTPCAITISVNTNRDRRIIVIQYTYSRVTWLVPVPVMPGVFFQLCQGFRNAFSGSVRFILTTMAEYLFTNVIKRRYISNRKETAG